MLQLLKFPVEAIAPDTVEDGAPNWLDLISAPAGRGESRALADRLRLACSKQPGRFISTYGAKLIEQGGLKVALAIGWYLLRGRDEASSHPSASSLQEQPISSRDDAEIAGLRSMAHAFVGQMILDGICEGDSFPPEERRASHQYAENLELLCKVGPADPGDEALLASAQLTADMGGFEPKGLAALLRAAFDQVERARPIFIFLNVDEHVVHQIYEQVALFDFLPETDKIVPVRPRPASVLGPLGEPTQACLI